MYALGCAMAQDSQTITEGQITATMAVQQTGELRSYELTSNADLRDNRPPERRVAFSEIAGHARVRTGNVLFDGLYAMAVHEALQNSVSQIKDGAYGNGELIQIDAFQTGEFWTYVWTRDLAYSVHLALGGFDPQRAVRSLLFKTSVLKASVAGGLTNQIIQDTGSGGSYPVSSDRVVWALGASETLKYLHGAEREDFLARVYAILRDTIEQDRRLVFDAGCGLYRGEQSFLDWREQTYPGWTRDNVLAIAMSKSLSVNAANYYLLTTAADYAVVRGQKADARRFANWAAELKTAINNRFYDREPGLYSAYLLSDGVHDIRVRRYDLLAESLAILFDIADQSRADAILRNYPVGPHGPSVVWPQEQTVPIYHNQAIWPFVTAYWLKAARKANCVEAVNRGIESLQKGAAFNLSNMENFDFISGRPDVKGALRNGPVVNSRRQLWSVAAYLSMVQDIVFGLETSWDGLRFQPFVTGKLRNETFASSEVIELRDFRYRNTRHLVRIHLPPADSQSDGVCSIHRMELNGRDPGNNFVKADSLKPTNQWDIFLRSPRSGRKAAPLRTVNVADERVLFGPVQPTWDETREGITVENGRSTLWFHHPDASNVAFNIYRDGNICARNIRQTRWIDASSDYRSRVHCYAVEAVDLQSGNTSHLTPFRYVRAANQHQVIPAQEMLNRGGNLVAGHHFENWGEPDDELLTKSLTVRGNGRHLVRVEFSNGSGPVNTGITCAVKKLELLKAGSREVVASGYLVMPQSGDWNRWDMSSPVSMNLRAGEEYAVRIYEHDYSRNMSYLSQNERYTAWPGGGQSPYNYVNVAAVHLVRIQNGSLSH